MASPWRPAVVVTLDGELHDPQAPLLHADDLAAVRGDGIFETLLIRDGRPCLLEAHLGRLTQSATMMDLPAPELPRWRAAVGVAVAAVARRRRRRGRAAAGVQPWTRERFTADSVRDHRRGACPGGRRAQRGVAAVTLARGLSAEGASEMPWLLAGAKTLSYAVNMAALRHAERHGAGDVIFVGSDGLILEGPRSTVVIATDLGGTPALLTPPPWYPILRGTTQQALFEVARNKGYDCDYRALRPADLFAAQGVWLVSSITLAARVHTLDGKPLRPGAVGRRNRRTRRRRDRLRSLSAEPTKIGCRPPCARVPSLVHREGGGPTN